MFLVVCEQIYVYMLKNRDLNAYPIWGVKPLNGRFIVWFTTVGGSLTLGLLYYSVLTDFEYSLRVCSAYVLGFVTYTISVVIFVNLYKKIKL